MKTKLLDKHPKGLWVISLAAAFFCYSYTAINSLLVIIVTTQYHMTNANAFLLSGTYNSLLFTLPLAGGYLAERLGYIRAFNLAAGLLAIALIFLSLQTQPTFIIGLAIFATGTGLFVPTYLVLIGKLYYKQDKRRESGYTISYIIVNVGFFMGGLASGFISQFFNYKLNFLIALVINLFIFIIYFLGKKHIKPIAGRSIAAQSTMRPTLAWLNLTLASLLLILIAYHLLLYSYHNELFISLIVIIVTIAIVYLAFHQKKVIARKRLLAFLILSYFSIGFFALYALEPSLITIFIKTKVNHTLFNLNIPPSSFYALDAFFIVSTGIILSRLWKYLSKINRNPSLPAKFTLSLFIMATGFLVIVLAINTTSAQLISPIWIVICYFLFALAELLITPIGFSMVGSLSPEGMEGRLMGVWQLFIGFSSAAAGMIAQLAVLPDNTDIITASHVYSHAFLEIGLASLCIALLSLLLIPSVKRLILMQRITRR